MTVQTKSIVKDMATLVDAGAKEIKKQQNVDEATAIWVAFVYACEWITENKPEMAERWIEALKQAK